MLAAGEPLAGRGEGSGSVVPAVELAPGYRVAPLITGCWQLAADHGASSLEFEALCERWRAAVDAGYTTFDCADIYTGVEALLGRFLRRLDDPAGVQVHTKYVPDRGSLASLDRARVERAIDRSLRRLGRETIDLLQFHWWDYAVPGAVETAIWLDELRQAGKIRHLGLTNFDLAHVERIVAAGVNIAAVQVQYSVLDRRPENAFASWCQQRGIGLLCYGTLAGGLLSERYLGASESPERDGNRSLTKYRLIVDEAGGWDALQETLTALAAVGRRHHASPSVAALRWVLDRPAVRAAIVGASSRDRRAELATLWSDSWRDASWAELSTVLERRPGPRGAIYGLERDPAGPHQSILRTDLREQ